ncbi:MULTISPECIES: hemerythrin domain-containing protein [Streptomyces]|uniref:hemerythrin domain-containing protein n=1 Tax=Streptomyces TaxID=1883 RepID=UPI00163C9537|nr:MULTISPECIES: hemerythrin domain-containing protein [Streptomyces]MBC2878808.1 hemerythrin domain-containing protein [Streptomyces sp. TYQ1024]UBI39275.1 hemerythrin domain-containing protein [Streptomyces mobaraensis]UKW31856.1 hemerythrin domain-containing protein [Streptomyces sp. TYQ1024]
MTPGPTDRARTDHPLATVYAIHDAFRRDTARLMAAIGEQRAAQRPGVRAGWETFKCYLALHHAAEAAALWPALRTEPACTGGGAASLTALVRERERLCSLASGISTALAVHNESHLRCYGEDFCTSLLVHLDQEETEVFPMALAVLSPAKWQAYMAEQSRRVRRDGSALYYPWLLDGAPESTRRYVLNLLSPAARLAFHTIWSPRYRRSALSVRH